MKLYKIGMYTVVAENKRSAMGFINSQGLGDIESPDELEEINPLEHTMIFPVEELPSEYQDRKKYPVVNYEGIYDGVVISLKKAAELKDEPLPYILSVSEDV